MLLYIVLVLDLVINCLLCTPFFTVSSYSVKETNNKLFKSTNGFPVQTESVLNVLTSLRQNNANWYNLNVYRKEVSGLDSYFGPLTLKSFIPPSVTGYDQMYDNPILFSTDPTTKVNIVLQNPNKVSAFIDTKKPIEIFFQQNFYAGWKAYLNNKEIPIQIVQGIMKLTVNESGELHFIYKRKSLYIVAIIVNSIILLIILFHFLRKIRQFLERCTTNTF